MGIPIIYCSHLIDEWSPSHHRSNDGLIAVATDYGGEGRINPAWLLPIINRLVLNPSDETVELSYPAWLSFLDPSGFRGSSATGHSDYWPDLHEVKLKRDAAKDRSFPRLFRAVIRGELATRRFETDVQTAVELFRAVVAWRDSSYRSVLFERHGVRSTYWAHHVACVSCPTIWIVTDPELPLTLISDRPGLYEMLDEQRHTNRASRSTRVVRDAQAMTIGECIELVYPENDFDWVP